MLSENVRISRVINATAAGTTDITSSAVDMGADGGYDGVLFIALFGTLTATQVTKLKAQQSSDDAAADAYADLEGSSTGPLADADSNKMLALDVKPTERYVKCVVDRGNANAVIDGVIAIQYRGNGPTSHDAALIAIKRLNQPAEGTA